MPDPTVNLEAQFLKVLLERSGEEVSTAVVAELAGWSAIAGDEDAWATARFVGQKLAHDGLVQCRRAEDGKWYAKLGRDWLRASSS